MSALHRRSPFTLHSALILLCSLFAFGTAAADPRSDGWTVAEVAGTPRYSETEGSWKPLAQGDVLPHGAVIQTAADERARLTRGGDTMTIYSHSRVALQAPRGLLTTVIQYLGEVLFQVERTDGRRFEVNTPYMIAGVKGTTFGITVRDDASTAFLLDGRLEVIGARSGARTELSPGRFAQLRESFDRIRNGAIPARQHRRWQERSRAAVKVRHPEVRIRQDARLGAPSVGADRAAAPDLPPSAARRDRARQARQGTQAHERAVRAERRVREQRPAGAMNKPNAKGPANRPATGNGN